MPHQRRFKAGGNQHAGVWRHARRFLVLAVVAAIVSSSLLVKVEAAAGDLDTTFSGDGKQRTVFGLSNEFANAVAIQTDGKIVVAGLTLKNVTGNDFALARYNTDGTLDTTFSGDGKQVTHLSDNDVARGVAIQTDGKIVVAGEAGSGGVSDFALLRYNSDGTLDTTFNGTGIVTTNFDVEDIAFGVVIQPNGKIVLGGLTRANDGDFALARYNSNGQLDTTFSGDGKQTTDFGGGDDATAVALQSNGKIVLAGLSNINGTITFALARYNGNGALDMTFSGDGKQTTLIGVLSEAHAVAIQSDGKIVAAGLAIDAMLNNDFALARYNGNGSLDDGSVNDSTPNDMFGTDGTVTTDFFSSRDAANALAIQSDDKIVAAGVAAHGNNTNNDFALARYNSDGTLDMTFNGDGKQTTDIAGFNRDTVNAIAIQTDGKIVAAGFIGKTNSDFDFALARYLGD